MTSSFDNNPHSSAPYSQHYTARAPGFGEIQYDNTLTGLLPCLIPYVDNLITCKVNEFAKLARGRVAEVVPTGVAMTADDLVSGSITLELNSTPPNVNTTPVFTNTQMNAAFQHFFGRLPKSGDTLLSRIKNLTTIGHVLIGTAGATITLPTGGSDNNRNFLIRFVNSDYELINIGSDNLL
jgi:hypothetical protein